MIVENFSILLVYILLINFFYFTHELLYGVHKIEALGNFFFRLSVLATLLLIFPNQVASSIHFIIGILILPPHKVVEFVRTRFSK